MNTQTKAPEADRVIGTALAPLSAGAQPRAIVPTNIDEVWRISTILIKAGLAPKDFATPEKCSVAIMHGLEIGMPPMMALARIAVINGRPCVWGEAVVGIAIATGEVEDIVETISGEGDHMVATCRIKRKGIKSYTEASFSVADAKRAGLWDDRAKVKRRDRTTGEYKDVWNDAPWHRYPKRMLKMRARVAFRDLFADAFSGLYIAEELIGGEETEMRDVTPPEAQPEKKPEPAKAAPKPAPQVIDGKAEKVEEEVYVRDREEEGEVIDGKAEPVQEEAKPEPEPTTKRPLPPKAPQRGAPQKAAEAPKSDKPNPKDPEAYRAWVKAKLAACATPDAMMEFWDGHVEADREAGGIIPPDYQDLRNLFEARLKELES